MKHIAAALTLFTRLPVWRLTDIPSSYYSTAVVCWPLTGWLTGGLTGLTLYTLSFVLPLLPAVVSAIIIRLLLTGALHEDGLADFCDGFGGGHDREGILRIMKDSHIGTYGVIGLICYFLLTCSLLDSLPAETGVMAIFAADPFAKCCASQLTNILNYARPEGAKNRISYSRMTIGQLTFNLLSGILPITPIIIYSPLTACAVIFPLTALFFMIKIMKHRIGGYTGDCCGATFLICEAAMLTGIVILTAI
ncbi:MAG: adenosylcobinamide-GDP ribazoletransferase [Muribaculaceae bacterium]|nr:adenosylcobinamide-GDP ribazoletransferase [Muribaculaceae bacterium]